MSELERMRAERDEARADAERWKPYRITGDGDVLTVTMKFSHLCLSSSYCGPEGVVRMALEMVPQEVAAALRASKEEKP